MNSNTTNNVHGHHSSMAVVTTAMLLKRYDIMWRHATDFKKKAKPRSPHVCVCTGLVLRGMCLSWRNHLYMFAAQHRMRFRALPAQLHTFIAKSNNKFHKAFTDHGCRVTRCHRSTSELLNTLPWANDGSTEERPIELYARECRPSTQDPDTMATITRVVYSQGVVVVCLWDVLVFVFLF